MGRRDPNRTKPSEQKDRVAVTIEAIVHHWVQDAVQDIPPLRPSEPLQRNGTTGTWPLGSFLVPIIVA